MARKRFISPSFFKHHDLYRAEVATGLPLRIGFEALWCQADRRGLFRWKPVELKLECMPYDDVDFEAVLFALEDRGFLECYAVEGKLYGRIPSFADHQSFHVAEKPDLKIPDPIPGAPKPVRRSGQHGASTVSAPCKHGVSTPVAVAVAVTATTAVTGTTDVTARCDDVEGNTGADADAAPLNSQSTAPASLSLFEKQEHELRAVAQPHEALALDLLLEPLGKARFAAIGELYAIAKRMDGHEVRGKNSGRPAGPTEVMRALSEMAAGNMQWSVPLFRGCVRRLMDRPPEPPTEVERESAAHARQIASRANVTVESPRDPAEVEAKRAQREAAMATFFELAGKPSARPADSAPPRRAVAPPMPPKGGKGGEPAPIGDVMAKALGGMLA